MGNTQFLLTMKTNSLTIFRIHQIKIHEIKINNCERRRGNLFFFILDNQFHLQSPFELFEDNFYTTVGMIQT